MYICISFLKKSDMPIKAVKRLFGRARLSLKAKLVIGLLAIAAVLLVSSFISVKEYTGMSHHVSDLIAEDLSSISVANVLADMSNTYNLQILEVIGNDSTEVLPAFDDKYFKSHCDSLRMGSPSNAARPLADSVMYSYSAYMLTSMELETVLRSDFIDTRAWYFDRLQPRFERLRSDLDNLTRAIYKDLENNSKTFDKGFYHSIIPGILATCVGVLLIVLLLILLLHFYANPLYKILASLNAYRTADKKYTLQLDSRDQMQDLNDGIAEIANENRQLRSRIKAIKK